MAWSQEKVCVEWLRDGKGPVGGKASHVAGGEAFCRHMYLDKWGLVTIGVGNLIDASKKNALIGPKHKHRAQSEQFWLKSDRKYHKWLNPGNYQGGTKEKVKQDWINVKMAIKLKTSGGGAFKNIAKLRMKEQSLKDLISLKVKGLVTTIMTRPPWNKDFGDFNHWPVDAQVALVGLIWAVGPGRLYYGDNPYPKLCAACKAWDFLKAAEESSQKKEGSPYSRMLKEKRNYHKKVMFTNAAHVLHQKVVLNKPVDFKTFRFRQSGGGVLSVPQDTNGKPWKPTREQILQAKRP